MEIKVFKLTDVDLLRKCAGFTSGRDCKMTLREAFAAKHSVIRSQIFVIEMTDIPLFCASQFVRSHVGVQWYQRSKRTDRGGEDFKKVCEYLGADVQFAGDRSLMLIDDGKPLDDGAVNVLRRLDSDGWKIRNLPKQFDRYAPTDLCAIINADAIMNMSEKRLCSVASKETREIWQQVIAELSEVDPDLARFCVRPCVAHGGICREPKCCGFNRTEEFKSQLSKYKSLYQNESHGS